MNSPADNVHCAITRVAREGREAEFEAAIKRFVSRSMGHHGTTGAHLLHPADASRPREYGILRSFVSDKHMEEFYASDLFKEWQAEVEDLVEGEPSRRRLHGLEAFFRGQESTPPPRWKMAVVTWLGVFPVVFLWSRLLAPKLSFLHPVVATASITGLSVISLAWLVMPTLTRLFGPWLRKTA